MNTTIRVMYKHGNDINAQEQQLSYEDDDNRNVCKQ